MAYAKNGGKYAKVGDIGFYGFPLARRRSTWAARHSDRFAVTALVAHSSSEKLFEQVRQFHPKIAALSVEPKEIPADIKNSCQWMFGENVLLDVVHACDADDVLVSVVGVVGLAAVMETLACGKRVLLANKEPLVAGGELVTEAAKKAGHPLLPVDSRAQRHFPVFAGRAGQYADPPDSDGERRPVPHMEKGRHLQRAAGTGAQAPELEHGPPRSPSIPRR